MPLSVRGSRQRSLRISVKPRLRNARFRHRIRPVNRFGLAAITIAVSLLAFSSVAPAQDLADKAIQVWELVRDAEKDEAGNNGAAAYEKYKEAVRVLREIRAADPNWNPHLVDFRLKDCADRIAALEKSGKHLQTPPPAPAPAGTATPAISSATADQRVREEIAKLRADIEREKQEKAELQRKLTAAEDQARRLQVPPSAEVTRLRRERQQLEIQLREAQQRALEFQQRAAQTDAALVSLKTAQEELHSLRASLQAAERDSKRQHEELTKTAAALDTAQKDAAARLSRLVTEKSEFERMLQTATLRIAQLEGELKTAPSKEAVARLQTQLREETAKSADLQRQMQANADATAQLQAVRDDNARLQQSLAAARQALQQRDEEMRRTTATLEATQKNHATQLAALLAEKNAMEKQLNEATGRVRELQAANAALVPADKHRELQEKHLALQEQNKQLSDSIAQKTAQLAELQRVQSELDKTQKSLDEARQLADQRARQVQDAAQSLAAFQRDSNARLAALAAEKSELEKQLAANAARIRELERRNAPPDTVPKADYDALVSDLDGVKSQLELAQQALETANADLERQKAETAKLNASLAALQSKSHSQLADLAASKQDLERQLRAANDLIAALKQSPAATVNPDPQLLAELDKARAEKSALEGKIATQEAAMRAAIKEISSQLDAALSQRNALQSQLSTAESKLAQATTRAEKLAEDKKALEARLAQPPPAAAPRVSTDSATSLAALRIEKRDIEARLIQTERQVRQMESARDAVIVQKERVERQYADSQSRLAAAQQESAQQKALIARLTAQLEAARKQPAANATQPSRDAQQVVTLRSENRALLSTVERQQKEVVQLQREIERLRQQLAKRETAAPTKSAPNTTAHSPVAVVLAQPTPEKNEPMRLPESARAALEEADQLAAAQKFEEAAVAYEKMLQQYPQSVVVLANLGVVRMKQGRHDVARELLSRSVALAPDDSFSHSMLGLCHYFKKDYDNALASLSRALALDPKDALSLNYRGTTSAQKGWYEAAENDLRRAIELQPKFGDAHRNLASIYMKQRPPSPRLAHFHYLKSVELGVKPDAELQKSIEEKVSVRTERDGGSAQP